MSDVKMLISQVCEDAGKIWFYDNVHHYICCSDYHFDEIHVEKEINTCDVKNLGTGLGIFKLNQKLYIAYQQKPAVLVYLMQTKEYYVISFDNMPDTNIYNVERLGETIFFLPQEVSGGVFIFDMQQESFAKKEWMDKGSIGPRWTAKYLFRENEKVFLPIYESGLLVELDLLSYHYVIHKYEGISTGCVYRDESATWIAQTDSPEIICIENNNSDVVCKYNLDSAGGREFFSKLFVYNGKIVGIPRFGSYVLMVDPKNGKVSRLYHDALKNYEGNMTSLTYGYYGVGNLLYLLPWGTLKFFCVDMQKEIIHEKKIEIRPADYFKYFYVHQEYENDADALKDYLNWIKFKDCLKIENKYEKERDKCVGKGIHEAVKKSVL